MIADVFAGLDAPSHRSHPMCTIDGEVRSYDDMSRWAARIGGRLHGTDPGAAVGLLAGNSPEWVAADLALLHDGRPEIPLPLTFSRAQAENLVAHMEVCLVDERGRAKLAEWGLEASVPTLDIPEFDERHARLGAYVRPDASQIVKIIHTSGTTANPKGVRITAGALEAQLESIRGVMPRGAFAEYLSIVPLSLLIEQIAAVYAPMLDGGAVRFLPRTAALLGTADSTAGDVVTWLNEHLPSATVLPPAAVSALARWAASVTDVEGTVLDERHRPFIMAGGAPVGAEALHELAARGLPVYEGYGLSENTSVVAWNLPGSQRYGTVGKPLPHCEVRIAPDDELLVRSTSLFAGYVGADPTARTVDAAGWLATGDRAAIDDDGYVTILGRMSNTIITSHGRNISPEWVEAQLRRVSGVADVVLIGDGLEHPVALVLSADAGDTVRDAILAFSAAHLAETDRPGEVVVIDDSPAFRREYFTTTGRPRRRAVAEYLRTRVGDEAGAAEPTAAAPTDEPANDMGVLQ